MPLAVLFNKSGNLIDAALTAKLQGKEPVGFEPWRQKQDRKKRLAPFSIRLSEGERARLALEAAGAPLGAFIKSKVLGAPALENGTRPSGRVRRKGLPIQDREAHAQALALLGRSHLSNNLNQIAHAVNIGVLPVTPETEAELFAALNDVRELRRLLLLALGLKAEDAP